MNDLSQIELFAWLGEDELGSGEIGIKSALCALGIIPMVAISRATMEKVRPNLELQSAVCGKKISLCRFVFKEVVNETHGQSHGKN